MVRCGAVVVGVGRAEKAKEKKGTCKRKGPSSFQQGCTLNGTVTCDTTKAEG